MVSYAFLRLVSEKPYSPTKFALGATAVSIFFRHHPCPSCTHATAGKVCTAAQLRWIAPVLAHHAQPSRPLQITLPVQSAFECFCGRPISACAFPENLPKKLKLLWHCGGALPRHPPSPPLFKIQMTALVCRPVKRFAHSLLCPDQDS